MAYSLDLRKKGIDYRKTHTLEETHKFFGISKSTIFDWERLYEETGSLEKRPLNRTFKKIDPVELAKYIIENPDHYLSEIGDYFNCSATAVFYALENTKPKALSFPRLLAISTMPADSGLDSLKNRI